MMIENFSYSNENWRRWDFLLLENILEELSRYHIESDCSLKEAFFLLMFLDKRFHAEFKELIETWQGKDAQHEAYERFMNELEMMEKEEYG